MTTATSTATPGTKGRKVTITYEDGRVGTFTQKNGSFLAVVSTDPNGYFKGLDGIVGCSATRDGAVKLAAPFLGPVEEGGHFNLRIVEIIDPV
jgi:hypothetical protein